MAVGSALTVPTCLTRMNALRYYVHTATEGFLVSWSHAGRMQSGHCLPPFHLAAGLEVVSGMRVVFL